MIEPGANVSARTAILLVNYDQMYTRSWRYSFKVAKFPLTDQIVLSIIASQAFSWSGRATTMEALKAIGLFLSKSNDAADRCLRKLQGRYIVQRQNEDRGNVYHWNLKDADVLAAVTMAAEIRLIINNVVEKQLANLDDPEAGSELLPPEVYFNVIRNKLARDAAGN